MTTRAAMVLAAGFGTRMGPLTATRPKPLIEVAGRPLITHVFAAASGAAPIIVNGHYHADRMRSYLLATHPDALFIEETPDILESGGAIKHALAKLGPAPILTLNADAVWDGPAPRDVLEPAWDAEEMDALMLLVPRTNAIARQGGGDVVMAPDGRLTWDKGPEALVYTGAQILCTDRIAAHPERVFSLRDIWQQMIDNERLFGCLYPGQWADVGHPDGIRQAEAMLRHAV